MAIGTGAAGDPLAFDPSQPLIQLVEAVARRAPSAPALLLGDRTVTYGALMARVERLARALVASGVRRGDFVGLGFSRSEGNVTAMLAALKAGACFVPLDPGFADPVQLGQIVAQVPFAAVVQDSPDRADGLRVVTLDQAARPCDFPQGHGADPACMVFTSGSTGTPKGVVLANRGLAALALGQPLIGLTPSDVMLHASSLACDGGLIELWLSLLAGAAMAVVETPRPALPEIAAAMIRHRVTATLQYVGMHNLIVAHHLDAFATVRLAMAGGDVLATEPLLRLKRAVPGLRMVNVYGPSETTCISLVQEVGFQHLQGDPIPIGQPLAHETALVVGEDLAPLPDGTVGELLIGGAGVALGYHNRASDSFLDHPVLGRTYRTGDLALRRADGTFEFHGRADRQIKLAGRRIELDGLEHLFRAAPGVRLAMAEAVTAPGGDKRLGLALQPVTMPQDEAAFIAQVLASVPLPPEHVPRHIRLFPELPVTAQGKPDRKTVRRLLEEAIPRPAAPQGAGLRATIARIWDEILGCGPLADSATFFEAGGSSLQLIDAHGRLQTALGRRFDLTLFFERPRLGDLAEALGRAASAPATAAPVARSQDIAIIGYAARVPGAASLADFWDRQREGANLITRFSPEALEDAPARRLAPNYVPARSILPDVELFDAKHFGLLPREAERMDPQARVFLELCTEALDSAALDPARAGDVGVYAGSSPSTYLLANLMADRASLEAFTQGFQVDDYTLLTGNVTDTLATRAAWKLDLKGPAMTVHTACSTGLTAIAQAVTALRAGQCAVALAGGISITFPQRRGYLTQEGGMSSADGVCRPFDAEAGGTVFGHGGGVVVLKPLAQALQDGDRIEGILRGIGLNNDGADKISFTAPSVTGQAAAIRAAHRDAGVRPEEISFVECHGTATPLGDPIEVRALRQAFGEVPGRIALGSIKGSIGHLDAGAGAVSVIRTLQAMKAQEIPPMANFRSPSPRIDFGPFQVPTAPQPWQPAGPRIAGVSGFGVGGTNVHLVLQEPPPPAAPTPADEVQILPLSARSAEALERLSRRIEALSPPLPDAALTLQDGRRAEVFRSAVALSGGPLSFPAPVRARPDLPVAFLFPGQGAQYPGMGAGLMALPTYARWIEAGCAALGPLGARLRPFLTAGGDPETLRQTELAQPALFLVQHALAQVWIGRGIRPAVVLGHSVGEFAAAVVAGVMGFETALHAIAARGRLMQAQAPGAMLAVRAPLDQLMPLIGPDLDLAAENAPRLQVLAGPEASVAEAESRLTAEGITHRRLQTYHAFHSRMMAGIEANLAQAFTALAAPQLPMISTVTGEMLGAAEATDPAFWAAQARAPVRFAKALAALQGAPALLEVGPGATLTTLAAQTLPREAQGGMVQSLPEAAQEIPDMLALARATARLWTLGAPVNWAASSRRGNRKLDLPGTVFLRKRHWIDPPAALPAAALPAAAPSPAESPAMPVRPSDRPARLTAELAALLTELSGEAVTLAEADSTFLELGYDSLFLGQMSQALARRYGVEISFRSLLSDHPTMAALAAHLDALLPPETTPAPMAASVAAEARPAAIPSPPALPGPSATDLTGLMQAQMQTMQALFAEQLRVFSQAAPRTTPQPAPTPAPSIAPPPAAEAPAAKEPLRFGRAPALGTVTLTPGQAAFARDLAERYSARFPGSKSHTAAHRAAHADPRSVAGFRAEWKEMAFPLVVSRAKGARIEDVDGNALIDLVNGFGTTAFGHAPDFVTRAVAAQMERGFPIGPQHDRAGPVAGRLARLLGHDRVTFCNTGSEAVMAAMRLARAVTGRKTVVSFSNDYHGQFDEVLVKPRARGEPGALPLAPGIAPEAVANMVVLPWANAAALDWIRDHGDRIAAVVVEPVQSRHPEIQPRAFVEEIRRLTREAGAALVMDEVVTGFRTHARGLQGLWDIEADLATYGKVVGGGMPVGLLAGKRRFMDALDGGDWHFGDDSAPQVAPTFFAGTFVRHPLVVAAVEAVLDHLEAEGATLWETTARRTGALAQAMNAALALRGLPALVTHFSSWFMINVSQHDPRATLLFPLMRLAGVHVIDGFCGFLTTAHAEAECAAVLSAFEGALDALQAVGILAGAQDLSPDPVPLTESQREIWMTHQLGDLAAASFNESVSLRLEGEVDAATLSAALGDLVARHDALRLRFARDGASFQVMPPAPVALTVEEVTPGDLAQALEADASQPVDIAGGQPLRLRLFRVEGAHVLVMTAHHILCDGWSWNTLATELAELYTARLQHRAPRLDPAPSFAAHARTAPAPDAATRAFWRQTYADVPPLPDLPTDRPRPARKSFSGATASARLPLDLVKRLRKAGAAQGATLFSVLFAGLQLTLGRLAGSSQVVLGVPTGGQAKLADPGLVGHLVNFLPIRADFAPGDSVATHLARVRDAVASSFDHGSYTLGTLVRDLDLPRTLSRLPLTEVQFNLERVPEDLSFGPARASLVANPKAAVNFDLFFNMVEGRDGLRIDIDYNTDLYEATTVLRWVGHLQTLLTALAEAPGAALSSLPLMTEAETRDMAERWNRSARPVPSAMVHDLLAPPSDAAALRDAAGALTYAELHARIDALAAAIQAQVPGQGERIAVNLPRGTGMVVALLAVLRAGHAYVPVDPDLPPARQQLILTTARVAATITEGLAEGLRIAPEGLPGTKPERRGTPQDTAYVIFTSGSTGTPKGVEVAHSAVVNFLTATAETPGLSPTDKLLAVTTVSFDIAVLELILPLTVGAEVEIASRDDIRDGFALVRRLERGDITVMQATPTLWSILLEAGLDPKGLRILAGGEPLAQDLADRLSAGVLWNLYGPTETTVWSALSRISGEVTIGAPLANTELHVLDETGALCAPGQVGELAIGGAGLAKGYFDRPDLTEAAFRTRSVAGREVRLYHTGDLARRDADGRLRLLGRRDGQVKLRGFRIELDEIETRLRALPGISAAAVALRDGRMVAYVVGNPEGAAAALSRELPDYMVPTLWQRLQSLPQTANGKLDRKALPEPVAAVPSALDTPATATERTLAAIWCEVLGLKDISVTETIFALGIDSLAVFRLAARMMVRGLGLEARHVLEHPTLRELAAFADQRGGAASPARPSVKDFLRRKA